MLLDSGNTCSGTSTPTRQIEAAVDQMLCSNPGGGTKRKAAPLEVAYVLDCLRLGHAIGARWQG